MSPSGKPQQGGKRCSICGRRVRANFDNTARTHFLDQANYDPETRVACDGSNKLVTQELRRERVTRR